MKTTVTIATVAPYNAHQYSRPWVGVVKAGQIDFNAAGRYVQTNSKDPAAGGEIIIDDPTVGTIYACGQKNKFKSDRTLTAYLRWTGKEFEPVTRQGAEADYEYMQDRNGNVTLMLDEQDVPEESQQTASVNWDILPKVAEKLSELSGISANELFSTDFGHDGMLYRAVCEAKHEGIVPKTLYFVTVTKGRLTECYYNGDWRVQNKINDYHKHLESGNEKRIERDSRHNWFRMDLQTGDVSRITWADLENEACEAK